MLSEEVISIVAEEELKPEKFCVLPLKLANLE
jgi:hypothetical protein